MVVLRPEMHHYECMNVQVDKGKLSLWFNCIRAFGMWGSIHTLYLIFLHYIVHDAPQGGTPIYISYIGTVKVSFSGSSVFNRVYDFTFACLKQGCPRKSSPILPLQSQNFLLDRVAKSTSFVSWTGSGFCWVGRTPIRILPFELLRTPTTLHHPTPPPGWRLMNTKWHCLFYYFSLFRYISTINSTTFGRSFKEWKFCQYALD